jgi:hypothetical protein
MAPKETKQAENNGGKALEKEGRLRSLKSWAKKIKDRGKMTEDKPGLKSANERKPIQRMEKMTRRAQGRRHPGMSRTPPRDKTLTKIRLILPIIAPKRICRMTSLPLLLSPSSFETQRMTNSRMGQKISCSVTRKFCRLKWDNREYSAAKLVGLA